MTTKTEATKQARAILAKGHFAVKPGDPSGAHAYVYINGDRVYLYGRMGRLSHGEMVKQLTQWFMDRV